jgi:hypothetical protein
MRHICERSANLIMRILNRKPCLFTGHTSTRQLEVKISIADIASIDTGVIVSPTQEMKSKQTWTILITL